MGVPGRGRDEKVRKTSGGRLADERERRKATLRTTVNKLGAIAEHNSQDVDVRAQSQSKMRQSQTTLERKRCGCFRQDARD